MGSGDLRAANGRYVGGQRNAEASGRWGVVRPDVVSAILAWQNNMAGLEGWNPLGCHQHQHQQLEPPPPHSLKTTQSLWTLAGDGRGWFEMYARRSKETCSTFMNDGSGRHYQTCITHMWLGGGGGACRWRRQGAHHVFLIKEYCLNVSAGRDGGCSHSGITRVPGSERKREGSQTVQEV